MDKRRLGASDIEVTPIGLGCWQFSQGQGFIGKVWGVVDQETVTSIVRTARLGGINWFDTAEAYGGGASERALSAALQGLGVKQGDVVVATKWQPVFRTARSIGQTIDRRLECLRPYPIDLHQVHNPMSVSPLPLQMTEMAKLLKAGKIRSVGISNFGARQMELAHAVLKAEGIPLVSNQVRINLLDRRIEDNGVLEAARRLGVTLIAWSPLAQGILTGRFHQDRGASRRVSRIRRFMGGHSDSQIARSAPLIEALTAIGKAYGATPAQVALNWLVTFYGETVIAIPGATKPAQAGEAAAAMGFRLTAAELSRLDEVSRRCTGRAGARGNGRTRRLSAGGGAMKKETATIGGGCFWCLEAVYKRTDGVLSVGSGYAGGTGKDPSYEEVCTGSTGHAEVVRIEYNADLIPYTGILDLFWKAHDPTTLNRQGADVGTQYRSIILWHDEAQKKAAEESVRNAQAGLRGKIVTEITPLEEFYPAEDYHRDYYDSHRSASYCRLVIAPKLEKLGLS